MNKFLYKAIYYFLTNAPVDFKHFELFNNQVNDLNDTTNLPAIYLEIPRITWDYKPQRLLQANVNMTLHILSEQYSSTDAEDRIIDKSLDHLDLIDSIHHNLDGKRSSDIKVQLTDNDDAFLFNAIDIVATRHVNKIKSRFYSTIEIRTNIKNNIANHFEDKSYYKISSFTNNYNSGMTIDLEENT